MTISIGRYETKAGFPQAAHKKYGYIFHILLEFIIGAKWC